MRSAHLLPLKSLLVIVTAALVLGNPAADAKEPETAGSMAKRFEQLGSILNPDTPEDTKTPPPSHVPSRLPAERHTSGLHGSSLEADTSLNTPARGLTPSDEWRRMFPQKRR